MPEIKGSTGRTLVVPDKNNSRHNDDDYLSSISQYKDKSWYNRLLENPFMASKVAEFSPTFWQEVGENLLGDTSARDNYYAQISSQREQWLSDMLQQLHQQDYDSPLEQVSREQAAGLNPDLNGGITPGQAAENDQPINPVGFPTGSDAGDAVRTIGSMSMNFVSQILGMAQAFQSLQLGNLELESKEISYNESARDFVVNQIAGTSFFNSENDLDNMTPGDLANNIIAASSKVDYSTYSPRTRKLIKSMFGRYAKDVRSGRSPMAVESLKSELRNRIASNNKNAASIGASPLFNEDFMVFLGNIAEAFGDAEYKAEVAEFESRKAKADYNSHYFHSADGKLAGEAQNEVSRSTIATESQKAIVEGMWDKIYSICKDSNSWYGTIGLILIPFLRSMVSNMSIGAGRYGKDGKFGFTGINF